MFNLADDFVSEIRELEALRSGYIHLLDNRDKENPDYVKKYGQENALVETEIMLDVYALSFHMSELSKFLLDNESINLEDEQESYLEELLCELDSDCEGMRHVFKGEIVRGYTEPA